MAVSAMYDLYLCPDCDHKFLIESEAEFVVDVHCPYCGQQSVPDWKNAFDLSLALPMIPPEAGDAK